MKHILITETGSFNVIGGAAKDVYKIYKKLRLRKGYNVHLLGEFSKIDRTVKTVSEQSAMEKRYDLIWMNSIRDVAFAERYRRAHPDYKTKFMYVDRGNVLLNFERARLKRLLPKMLARRYLTAKMQGWLDYYIAISAEQYSHASKFFKGKTVVKYIMIAPHEEFKIIKMKKSFNGALTASRLDERQKKVSIMIHGIAHLKERHKDIGKKEVLRIVGTGIDEARYKRLADSLGLSSNITFRGFMTGHELIKEYNNALFYVSTSEWEGLGRSLLEAMACGLPLLINPNINTMLNEKPPERLVKEGYNGMLYDYGNLDQFADKFYKMYTNKRLQESLSANTRKFMKRFSFAGVVRKYESIIDSL